MTTEKKRQRANDAEHKAAMWLGLANEAEERGDKEKEETYLARAQTWLDRANELRGYA